MDMGTPQGSMGVCSVDFDNDLRPDIWVCNYENQSFALYKNDGNDFFRYATASSGLLSLGTTYVAFGVTPGDFDLDGFEDVVVANGHVMKHTTTGSPAQNQIYLRNTGEKTLYQRDLSSDELLRSTVAWARRRSDGLRP